MTKLFVFLSVFLSLSHTSLCQEQTPPEKPKSFCLRWTQKDLCGTPPISCGSEKCKWDIEYPTNDDNDAVITYHCDKEKGRFDDGPLAVGWTCEEIWSEDESGFEEAFPGVPDTSRNSLDLCWRLHPCLTTCVELPGQFQDIPLRHGIRHEVLQVCADSNQQWEAPENRPPHYSVEDVYGTWMECPDLLEEFPPLTNIIKCLPPKPSPDPVPNPMPPSPQEDP